MRRTAPLFRFDPGWLFTLAGLAVMVSAALLPAQLDLHDLRQQRAAIEAREKWNRIRIEAYDRFLADLERRDPALLRRLAASQLNLMPKGEQPLLMATSIDHTVCDWIDETVPPFEFEPLPAPDTLLARLAEGPRRLWLMAGGAMSVFLGLVMGFGVSQRPHLAPIEPAGAPDTVVRDSEAPASESVPDAIPEAAVASIDLAPDDSDVEDPLATAEPVEHERFDWPDAEPAFEVAEPESSTLHDGAAAELAVEPTESAEDWLRDHGTD